jgi:signal peptidase I
VSARPAAVGRWLVTRAVRGRRGRGGDWGEALLAEFDQLGGTGDALRWTVGGLQVAWRERRARFAALPRRTRWAHRTGYALLVALLLSFPGQAFLATVVYIPSAAMQPTIDIGDRVLVDRISFHLTGLRPGDVVLFRATGTDGHHFASLSRVLGLPGDRITCVDGAVRRNGAALSEPYLPAGSHTDCAASTVGPGQLYLLSDNREATRYSPSYGTVPAGTVRGRMLGKLWHSIT